MIYYMQPKLVIHLFVQSLVWLMINLFFMLGVLFFRLFFKLESLIKWSRITILGSTNYQTTILVRIVEALGEEFPCVVPIEASWLNFKLDS